SGLVLGAFGAGKRDVIGIAIDPASLAELVGRVVGDGLRPRMGGGVDRDQARILDIRVDSLIDLLLDMRGLRANEAERSLSIEGMDVHGSGLLSPDEASRGQHHQWSFPSEHS